MESTIAPPPTPSAESSRAVAHVTPLLYGLIFICLLLIPLRIISYGYIPPDDAMRHAAKAISGKDWPHILVLRPEIQMDSHPGWHAILCVAHRVLGADVDGLVAFSVFTLMFLFLVEPLLLLRRPEAWIYTMLGFSVLCPWFLGRLSLGRPYIVSMMVVLAWCALWPRLKTRCWPATALLFTVLFALSTWIHCSWYLLSLMVISLLLAREWAAGWRLAGCFVLGVLLGASITGHPFTFLYQTFHHMMLSLGNAHLTRMLVTEFQPAGGDPLAVMLVVALLLWRKLRGEWDIKVVDNPVFIMVILGWVLGFRVQRFWSDWAMPALLFWTACELQRFFAERVPAESWTRLGAAALAGVALFFSATSDLSGRWTSNLTIEYLDMKNPEHAEWLPEPGGIIYNDAMYMFYRTFYANPHGDWRYVLGFEPGIMLPEDLKVYRKIQWNRGDPRAYAPWIKKMRPQDRMLIDSPIQPKIEGLEWHYTATNTWLGRLPRKPPASRSAASTPPAAVTAGQAGQP